MSVIPYKLQEEGDILRPAFISDALDPCMFEVVDSGFFERGVIQKNLDAVGAGLLQSADTPEIEQVWKAAFGCGVIAGLLVGEQESGTVTMFRGLQTELGVKENRRGVPGKDLRHDDLEFTHVFRGDSATAFACKRFAQGAALVHGGGGDDAILVGDSLQTIEFAGGDLHRWVSSWVFAGDCR